MNIKKNMIKRFIAVLILSCVSISYTSMAEDIKNNAIFNNSVTNEIVPMRTNYLKDGKIIFSRSENTVNVSVKTNATTIVSHLYHDVTISHVQNSKVVEFMRFYGCGKSVLSL